MAAAVASALLLPALTGPSRTAQLKAGLSPLCEFTFYAACARRAEVFPIAY